MPTKVRTRSAEEFPPRVERELAFQHARRGRGVSARKLSSRVAHHFTGRPTRRAA